MKFRLLPILVAAVLGLCAQANAAHLYYLVGVRHVYSIPVLPDPRVLDRQAIEETYSAAVADAQKHFDSDMASIHDDEAKDNGNVHQADRDQVQLNLEKDIADAADKREADLASIYTTCDYVRESHPEFKVDQDGPYHVVEVETRPSGEYANVVYYQPYPLFIDVCPFGWGWGRPYPYATWGVQINLFHSTWISIGAPVFAPMFYGGAVFVVNAPIRGAIIFGGRAGWVGGFPPRITGAEREVLGAHAALQARAGYFDRGPGGRPLSSFKALDRTPAPRAGGSRYGGGAASTAGSRYSRGGSSATSGGASRYSRTGSPSTGSTPASTGSRYSRTGSSGTGTASTSASTHAGGTGTSGTAPSSTGSRYSRTGSSATSTAPASTGSKYSHTTTPASGTKSTTGTSSTSTGSKYGSSSSTSMPGKSTTSSSTSSKGTSSSTTKPAAKTPPAHTPPPADKKKGG